MQKQLEIERAELEKLMKGQEEELRNLLEAEKREREAFERREAEAAKVAESQRAKLQFDLMDAITPVQQANLMAQDLGIRSTFTIKITKDLAAGLLVDTVSVVLTDDDRGLSETWTMEKFRYKFGVLQAEHESVEAMRLQGGHRSPDAALAPDSAFRATGHAPQVIGHARVMLSFLYFNLVLKDTLAVISYPGEVVGHVQFAMRPVWRTRAQKHAAKTAESIMDIPDLHEGLDIEVRIGECKGLPLKMATETRVAFSFPDLVSTALLPASFTGSKEEVEEIEKSAARGATYQSHWLPEEEETVNVDPVIGYRRTIRLGAVTKKVGEWLKEGELVVGVLGSNPSKEALSRYRHGTRGGTRGDVDAAAAPGRVESREEELKRLQSEFKALLPAKLKAEGAADKVKRRSDAVDKAKGELEGLLAALDRAHADEEGAEAEAAKAKQDLASLEQRYDDRLGAQSTRAGERWDKAAAKEREAEAALAEADRQLAELRDQESELKSFATLADAGTEAGRARQDEAVAELERVRRRIAELEATRSCCCSVQ